MSFDKNPKIVLTCQECGDKTPFAVWKNGVVLCDVCGEDETIERKGKHMARNWDEFQGRKKPRDR